MADAERVFCDTSVVIRYFTGDDPPRAYAAAGIIDSDTELVVSTGVVLEIVHALRTDYGLANPLIATLLIDFLTRDNVTVLDADRASLVAGLNWSLRGSARRIPDAIIAAAAERAGCDAIATFDEALDSPSVPVRLI
jgi:predicted nucleic acid-binding protein